MVGCKIPIVTRILLLFCVVGAAAAADSAADQAIIFLIFPLANSFNSLKKWDIFASNQSMRYMRECPGQDPIWADVSRQSHRSLTVRSETNFLPSRENSPGVCGNGRNLE